MKIFFPALFLIAHLVQAQKVDSLQKEKAPFKRPEDKITLSLYERVIWDTRGNVRYDENIVANFKLTSWLRGEGGIRFGHRPEKFDSYYHYKLELQTKSFWQTVRFFVRLSDDINKSNPVYSRSYYLAVAELRRPISKSFSFLAAYGQVLATHRDDSSDAVPSFSGTQTNYMAYKIGLRYLLKEKGFMEAMVGNYDVFNPYMPSNSFLQMHFEHDLSKRVSFTSNLRYQFNTSLDKPLSYFIIAGVRIHFNK
ncbi:MAG TPA: hypothetical protein VGQ59_15350 [Cyclobacteriaceae bacterium]|nr:hypothetical protein [Cyclobacteriaceae bacterium]